MKTNLKITVIINLLLFSSNIFTFGPLTSFFKLDSLEEKNNFNSILESQVTILRDDKTKLEESQQKIKTNLESTNSEITVNKEKVKSASGVLKEFLNQKLLINNQRYQILTEIEQTIHQVILLVDAHSKVLQEYKQDPEFKNKHLQLPHKSVYLFSDLQKINDQIGTYENELKDLEEKAKKVTIDLSGREKSQALAKQEYLDKKKQQDEFSAKSNLELSREHNFNPNFANFTTAQKGELIDEEEKLYKNKYELAQMRVKEVEQRRNFLVDTQIKITKLQLQILKEEYERVKRLFQLDEKYLKSSELELEQNRQDSTSKQRKIKDTIDGLDIAKNNLEEDLTKIKTQFNISEIDLQAITELAQQPNSLTGWGILIKTYKILNKISILKLNKEQLEAEIQKERAKLHDSEITTDIIKTWYYLSNNLVDRINLDVSQAISKEIKYYETKKAELQAADTNVIDKKTNVNNQINNNSKLLENIKNRLKELKNQKDIYKNHVTEYTHDFSGLKDLEEEIRNKSEPLSRILENWNQVAAIHAGTQQKIDSILSELYSRINSKSTSGILIKGTREFIPDIYKFFVDIKNSWNNFKSNLEISKIRNLTEYYYKHFYELLAFILQLIIIILIFLLIKLYLPDFINYLGLVGPQYGAGYSLSNFLRILLSFINKYLFGIFSWIILFLAIKHDFINISIIKIIFYLVSIPYLLYYAHKFLIYLKNSKLVNKISEERFFDVLKLLLYSTIIIFFFKEAFLTGYYKKSLVPIVLSAFNFIILQVSLLFLLSREQVLSIIPRNNSFFEIIYNYINKFYYFFLACAIFLILMSNPYVGYGPNFFNIISRIILILALIPLFSLIHNYIKRTAYFVFFQTSGEIVKERFASGKTAYGIFVIFSFIIWVFLFFILAANIWGYPIGFAQISEWLHHELFRPGIDITTGRPIIVMPITFLKVIGFIIMGFIIAYIFNKFLLRRVFDLLLVNIGVQNALLSLVRYTIIITTIIIGLLNLGLGSSLLYILAIIGGLGVAAKELITDFIAYFIILVQRPIKIGDLIRIDDDTHGVVRHITLRSVVLRRKNSVTVIIPNSQFMNRPVANWNYSRTFIAFDDILLTVPYKTDPERVKKIISEVLDSNINILKNPAPTVQLRDFTDNGYQFMIRGYLSPDKVLDQFDIASEIRIELIKQLRAQNIEIASPTRTINVISREELLKS